MEWLAENWIWLLVFIAFIGMHMGHGGHGGHESAGSQRGADDGTHPRTGRGDHHAEH